MKIGLLEEDNPDEAADEPEAAVEEAPKVLGMALRPLTRKLREEYRLDPEATGVFVNDVEAASAAAAKGIAVGDVLVEVNQQPVESVEDVKNQLESVKTSGRKSILLLVLSGGDQRFVALRLGPFN